MWNFFFNDSKEEQERYVKVAHRLGMEQVVIDDRGCMLVPDNIDVREFTRTLQEVIQEEKMDTGDNRPKFDTGWAGQARQEPGSDGWKFFTNCKDTRESRKLYLRAAQRGGFDIRIKNEAYGRDGRRILDNIAIWIPDHVTGFYDIIRAVKKEMSQKVTRMLMTPEDVGHRLASGEDPLVLSIEHWTENVAWIREGRELPATSSLSYPCALCTAHSKNDCKECVLYLHTGLPCWEEGSPWHKFQHSRSSPALALPNAIKMLNTLVSCLEYEPDEPKLPQFYIWKEGEETEGKVGLWLEYCGSDILLKAALPSQYKYTVLKIKQDGTILRSLGVGKQLGFHLVDRNKVEIN